MLRLAVRTAAVSAMAMAAPMLMSSMSVRADGEHGTLAREPAMDAANFKDFKLQKVQQVTHDTHKFTFALPKSSDELGLTVASFLLVKAEIDGETGLDGDMCRAVVQPADSTAVPQPSSSTCGSRAMCCGDVFDL